MLARIAFVAAGRGAGEPIVDAGICAASIGTKHQHSFPI